MIRTEGLKRMLPAVALASTLALIASGCGSDSKDKDSGSGTGGGEDQVLNVFAGAQTPIVNNFNPYSPSVQHAANGPILEPLFYFNKVKSGDPTPMLGDSFEWAEDGTSVTVKIKSGVKWNDGKDFTVDDVIWSFTNDTGKPTYLKTAEKVDDTSVKLTFDGAQFSNEFALLGGTVMLPAHVWKDVADPMTFTNENPVGTGPYMIDQVSESAYLLKANPNFREEGKPAIKSVRYLGIDSNSSGESLLTTGKLDWVSMFVAEPDTITDAGTISLINTPTDPTVLYTCSNVELGCTGAQTDVAVRQALNVALDRKTINEKAFVGHAAVISPTFALLGRDDEWIAEGMPKESPQTPDVAEAGAILEAAGYVKGGDGFYAKDGKTVEMTLTSVDGWSDYNSAAKLVEEQAREAGIKITVSTISWNQFADARGTGQYELIMGGITSASTADPFSIYRDWLTTTYTAKVGEPLPAGGFNFARYSNPDVDAAVVAAAATNDFDKKAAAYAIVQENIVNDLPYIPIVINATQTFYNSKDFTGWPTEDNLYAYPPSWGSLSAGVVLANLKPAS